MEQWTNFKDWRLCKVLYQSTWKDLSQTLYRHWMNQQPWSLLQKSCLKWRGDFKANASREVRRIQIKKGC